MSEVKKSPASQSPTTNGFDPQGIFKTQSSEYAKLPKHTQLIEDHLDNAAQTKIGFTCHEIFVSKTTSKDWVFAVIVQWLAESEKAITRRTLFNVDLEVTHEESPPFCGYFSGVPLVDVVESEFDGKQVVVGMLCIPVGIQYESNPLGGWFKDLSQKTEAGIRVRRAEEVRDEDMPFNDVAIVDKGYVFALEYSLKKAAKNRLVPKHWIREAYGGGCFGGI